MESSSLQINVIIAHVITGKAHEVKWDHYINLDWKNFMIIAEAEGVAPLLYWYLQKNGWPSEIPDSLKKSISNAYYTSSAKNSMHLRELEKILTSLKSKNIDVLVIKGADVALTLYSDIALRPMSDIDLIIRAKDLQKGIAAIEELGYRKQNVTYHVVLVRAKTNDIMVELHWNIPWEDHQNADMVFQWYWKNTILYSNGGRTLNSTANFLYLASHIYLQHRNTFKRLIWYYDLYLLLLVHRHDIDWQELRNYAIKTESEHVIIKVLSGIQERLQLNADPTWKEVINNIPLFSGNLVSTSDYRSKDISIFLRIKNAWMSVEPKYRAWIIFKLFFPSREHIIWKYHPKPTWLWPIFYLRRWIDIIFELLG